MIRRYGARVLVGVGVALTLGIVYKISDLVSGS